MESLLPDSVLNTEKAPFRAPDVWFVNAPDIKDVLSVDSVAKAGMVKPDAVRDLFKKDRMTRPVRERLYSLYVLHKWYDAFYQQQFPVLGALAQQDTGSETLLSAIA